MYENSTKAGATTLDRPGNFEDPRWMEETEVAIAPRGPSLRDAYDGAKVVAERIHELNATLRRIDDALGGGAKEAQGVTSNPSRSGIVGDFHAVVERQHVGLCAAESLARRICEHLAL